MNGLSKIKSGPPIVWNRKVPDTGLERFRKLIEANYNIHFDIKNGLSNIKSDPPVVWNKKVPDTGLERFRKLIEAKYNIHFASYWDFHKWSVQNYEHFWKEIWNYFGIISSRPYNEVLVKTGPGFLDNDWFSGALFNFAENILRFRDNRIALIYLDEHGVEGSVTFAEMFEKVKLYAAAFRKNGLRKDDMVCCFMSNRMEAVFAMLATVSIGAVWGGPLPYYGARMALNIVKILEPKFLIMIDKHQDNGIVYPLLDYLPLIVKNAPSIENVILIATDDQTYQADITDIPNCVFLEDFLQSGRIDGNIPDMIFEQLPFNHPICINFTSGTTALPKGVVHSAGTLLIQLRDFGIHFNVKEGDVICTFHPVGWSVWDGFVPSLALGVQLFLYCGSPFYKVNGKNFWDILGKYNVMYTYLVTSMVDKMDKMGMIPSPGTNLDHLKMIGIGGSPVKKENFEYLLTKVKKDLFIGSMYAATETFGELSGFDFNMPAYGGEIQAASLGTDIQCFNHEGRSVIGERGEVVVCTPSPCFPVYLWKDQNNVILNSTYFRKYPGIWSQGDQGSINPKTNGIVVFGRSDDVLKQNSVRCNAGDIYFAINGMEELQDYICVGQQNSNGDSRAILFVKMKSGYELTPDVRAKIEKTVENELFVDCVPEVIIQVPDIPYNFNNKRVESVVRKIVSVNRIPEITSVKNPECLKHYLNIPEVVNYSKI